MQTRRDQLQAYRFVTRRIVSAMLSGEPETTERPMRRFGLAVFGSAMLATIIFAGVGVYGFIFPSGAKLSDPSIVIERETGARYVFVDGQLHPVVNYASARLLLGSDNPAEFRVSANSLTTYPRGRSVGIANLPDPLPAKKVISEMSWAACSLRRSPGSTEFVTHLRIGGMPDGAEPLGDRSLLVEQTANTTIKQWVIGGGRRYPIGTGALAPLGFAAIKPMRVTSAFLESIQPGPDLAAPAIPGRNEAGPKIDGKTTKVGQLFKAADQHYVLLRSGLATIGDVMVKLLQAQSGTVTDITADAATFNRSQQTPDFDPAGFPRTLPAPGFATAEPDMVCAVSPAGAASVTSPGPEVTVYPRLANPPTTEQSPARTGPDGVRLADQITLPNGKATLVKTLAAPGDTTANTTSYLVTDQGMRYALPRENTKEVLASLGYGGIDPMPVPTFLLALIPTGPALDPVAARLYVDEISPTPTRTAG